MKRKHRVLTSNWLHDHGNFEMKVKLRCISGELTPFNDNHKLSSKVVPTNVSIEITPIMVLLRVIATRIDSLLRDIRSRYIFNVPRKTNELLAFPY